MQLTAIVEALLFAAPQPLTNAQIVKAISRTLQQQAENGTELDTAKTALQDLNEVQVQGAIDQLIADYTQQRRSFTIVKRQQGWRLSSCAEFEEWTQALFPEKRPSKLSPAALETLAIIAYRQPITKAAIEAIRGVAVDTMIQQLLDRQWLQLSGKAELPGRPWLYTTTDTFLDHFGLRSIDDLPNIHELRDIPLQPVLPAEPPSALL